MRRGFNSVVVTTLALLTSFAWPQAASEGLVAYWPMDDAAGETARDVSGHGHDLALKNTRWGPGALGSALSFDGGASDARTPLTDDLRPTDEVSVEAWVRVESFPAAFEGIGLVNAGASYLLRITGGKGAATPSFHIFTTQWGPVLANGAMQPGRWYHLVGTYDGAQMRIYVNGDLSGFRKRTGAINRAEGHLLLGRQVNPFNGDLDEVRVYRRALSPEQVAAAFASARGKLNPGVQLGRLSEPYEELFGPTRHHPAPFVTLAHLDDADLCFAVITDTHIGAPGEEGKFCHNWRVEETIRQINALKPEFVMHCGDMITAFPFHDQFEDQCRNAVKLLKQFQVPVHLVAGNHDIGNQRNMRVWDDRWLQRISRPLEAMLFKPDYRALYLKYFGEDYYSFQAGGCHFIVFDDEVCNSGYPLEEEQMKWLEEELRKARGAKAIFVFTHNPIFWNRPGEPGPKNYESVLEPARARLLALFERHPVSAVYTGHTHFAFTNRYEGIHLRTINSTTFNRNYQGVNQRMPGDAQIYDPYKLGYLIVRVRGQQFHESWLPLYWRVGEPPPGLAAMSGARLAARPPTEMADSVLGIRVIPPRSVSHGPESRELINDHWWRLAEDIGSKWMQVWPPPSNDEDWAALDRGLTLGRPRGVNIAVPLPGDAARMETTWARLRPHAGAIAAAVVCNGEPAEPAGPLTSWHPVGGPADWAQACVKARSIVPKATKIALARLPLTGDGALLRIREAAEALEGKADAMCVHATTQAAPEEELLEPIKLAAEVARTHRLGLWLDLAAWQTVDEPRRSAYFLRLLALCQSQRVRVFWWIGPDDAGGLLDSHWDPTALYYAAQSWQAMVDGPAEPVEIETAPVMQLRWRDARGRVCLAWWRRSDDMAVGPTSEALAVPTNAMAADPLHGRLLDISGVAPLCGWPLIARGD